MRKPTLDRSLEFFQANQAFIDALREYLGLASLKEEGGRSKKMARAAKRRRKKGCKTMRVICITESCARITVWGARDVKHARAAIQAAFPERSVVHAVELPPGEETPAGMVLDLRDDS